MTSSCVSVRVVYRVFVLIIVRCVCGACVLRSASAARVRRAMAAAVGWFVGEQDVAVGVAATSFTVRYRTRLVRRLQFLI